MVKSLLVHPKDKKNNLETSEVVYEVPCKGCNKTYVGESGRQLGVRLKEHQKDSEKIAEKESPEPWESRQLRSNISQP